MSRTFRPATEGDALAVRDAAALLRTAYSLLVRASAPRAAVKAYRALRSAEGAMRHVTRRVTA